MPKKKEDQKEEYEVGYGRPPTHTRFQPGKSGNPNGRPKGSKNTKTILMEELIQRSHFQKATKK